MESCHPTLHDASLVPDEFEDEHHHQALAMDHYVAAYEMYLFGHDLFPEQEKVLEDRYGMSNLVICIIFEVLSLESAKKDQRVIEDLELQKEKLKEASQELKQLLKAPVRFASVFFPWNRD